jgi:DNA-binding CsgD family transcriptional regulator
VLCDQNGDPTQWIGDPFWSRDDAQAYLDGDYRDDACFEAARLTCMPCALADLWIAPLLGSDGVIGMLRIVHDGADTYELTVIAAYISIRLAILGLSLEDSRSIDALTARQREVAELVAHGCTNGEIASMLSISANAVKKHVSRVLVALEVSNRTELAALTGRWRLSGTDQSLPPDLVVAVRNPLKPLATTYREKSRELCRTVAVSTS